MGNNLQFLLKIRSPFREVCIMIRLQARCPRNLGSVFGRRKRFVLVAKLFCRLC